MIQHTQAAHLRTGVINKGKQGMARPKYATECSLQDSFHSKTEQSVRFGSGYNRKRPGGPPGWLVGGGIVAILSSAFLLRQNPSLLSNQPSPTPYPPDTEVPISFQQQPEDSALLEQNEELQKKNEELQSQLDALTQQHEAMNNEYFEYKQTHPQTAQETQRQISDSSSQLSAQLETVSSNLDATESALKRCMERNDEAHYEPGRP